VSTIKTTLYQPEWDENDIPRVGCPNLEGKRVGSDFCHHECVHLEKLIMYKYREVIECAYPNQGLRLRVVCHGKDY